MIKRLTFDRGWAEVAAGAPGGARATGLTVGTPVPEITPEPRHDGLTVEWFDDDAHLDRARAWADGRLTAPHLEAEEVVLRGAEWHGQRWERSGPAWKHVALAQRAPDLTPATFAERWRDHAGRVGTTPVPDDVQGRAYVQDHPVLGGAPWPYDAVNEVWLDSVDDLARRDAWLRETVVEDDLFGPSWFLAVREVVLPTR